MSEAVVLRKCLACNKVVDRNNLIKVTKNKNGEIKVMPDTKFFGHSYYICRDIGCIESAFKKGRIFKLLKISQSDSLKEKIRAVLES